MNRLYFIRHGKTAGNELKRYIGRTDEPLSPAGRGELAGKTAPQADIVAVSPLRRCRESAQILYPQAAPLVVDGLRECDFGDFEGKNYLELAGNAAYQAWVDSNGTLPFPHGEEPLAFRARCVRAFEEFAKTLQEGQSAALVVHGGTIMAIFAALALPKREFYDWQIENGQGFCAVWDGKALTVEGKLWQ